MASNICLFKPMSSEQIKEYSFMLGQSGGFRNLCDRYDEMYPPPENVIGRSISGIMGYHAEITFLYLQRHYESLYKKTKRYPESLAGTSKWGQIRHDNPFSDMPMGLLGGFSLTNKIPSWKVGADYEWQGDYRDPETICPHMMLVIYTSAVANEGELLQTPILRAGMYCTGDSKSFRTKGIRKDLPFPGTLKYTKLCMYANLTRY